ncbi:MAG: S-adenosyl-methyltransferase MraW [Phycisphaerales bacterium]|nr:S-adenosyl-methyltransferase MraW [Phycisphaerales bacterium]
MHSEDAGMELPASGHDPVLMNEVLEALAPAEGKTIVDCTLGRAGHAVEIARRLGRTGRLIGLDVDPRNLEFARERLVGKPETGNKKPEGDQFKDKETDKNVCPTLEGKEMLPQCEVRLFHANFAELGDVLGELGISGVDGVLADLGISTNQLFDPHYGLSFGRDAPLDMRIDSRIRRSAADLVNSLPEEELANVLYQLAQERYSRRIARKIAEERRISPITTTERLAEIVRSAIGHTKEKIDQATRTFLALRMAVNQEMENTEALLKNAPRFLNKGGRFAVISFQSMEDRLAKQAFRVAEQTGAVRLLTKRPVGPGDEEVLRNPRSRSAKLRVVEKV